MTKFVLIGVRNGEQSWDGRGWHPDQKSPVAIFDKVEDLKAYVEWAKLANPVYSKHHVYRSASVLYGYDRAEAKEVTINPKVK